jgi:hypothetical protein
VVCDDELRMLVISGLFMSRRTSMGWGIRQRHFQVTKKRKKSRTGKKDKEDKDNKHYWGYKEHNEYSELLCRVFLGRAGLVKGTDERKYTGTLSNDIASKS